MNIDEKIDFIRQSRFIDGKYHRYTNSIQINGFLISKPIETTLANGKQIMTFYIMQILKMGYSLYHCQVFSKPIQEQIRNIENCSFINVLGRLVYSKKTRYSLQVEEILVSHEYLDKGMELEPPYQKKEIDNGNNE